MVRWFVRSLFFLVCVVGCFEAVYASGPSRLNNFPSKALQQQATRFAAEFKKASSDKGVLSAQQLLQTQVELRQALSEQSLWWAESKIETLLANGLDDFSTWFVSTLAWKDAALRQSYSVSQRKSDRAKFLMAATNAFLRAEAKENQALVLWCVGEVFDVAALKNRATQLMRKSAIREKIRELIAQYPNTFAPYASSAKEQTSSGQVCIQWTHPVNAKMPLKDYIDLKPEVKDFGVRAQGSELCLQGLEFGESYEITLKPGLPGLYGRSLKTTETLAAYVPHQGAMVAFREQGYVLPQQGPKILPLTTMNVESVKVSIFAVPLRNLNQPLKQGQFLQQLSQWQKHQIATQEATKIWTGTFPIEVKANRPVTTGLPLDKMLGKDLEPGLYIAQAVQDESGADTWETPRSTQWFVISDLGLTSFTGPDGLHIMVRSLQSATPLKGVALSLIATNNRILQTQTTDHQGRTQFADPLMRGKGGNEPLFVQAVSQDGQDISLLSLQTAPHAMTDRGDAGRVASKDLDLFLYGERDLYRPGETINVVGLLRNQNAEALPKTPLVFQLKRPDGVEVWRKTVADAGEGSYAINFPTAPSSQTGVWTLFAYADIRSAPIARFEFHLSDFVPPQIEASLHAKQQELQPNAKLDLTVEAQYLFGAPAQSLKVEGTLTLQRNPKPFARWDAYVFGLEEAPWYSQKLELLKSSTDAQGQAQLKTILPAAPETSHLLEVLADVTVYEVSGRPRRVKTSIPFWHQDVVFGIAPQFQARTAPYKGLAKFSVIAVDQKGAPQSFAEAHYRLYKETLEYTWFKEGSHWKYEPVVSDSVVAEGRIPLNAKKPASLQARVLAGRYRLEIYDPASNRATSYRFHAGWGEDLPHKRPDKIELTLNQQSYKPGDSVEVFVKPPYAGQLVLSTLGQTLQTVHTGHITDQGLSVAFRLTEDMINGPGLYVLATVYRPFDLQRRQKADRAIGLHWMTFDTQQSRLPLEIQVPEKTHPNQALSPVVRLSGVKQPTFLTVAAVDDAVLQLTDFATPDPVKYFFSQRALAYQIRDVYGQLINPDNAKPGSFRVGGGGGEVLSDALADLPIRSTKIVSLFSGIVQAGEDGTAEIPLQLPEFAGRVRVMAVAWNATQVGSASKQVKVHDDVIMQTTVPRFLSQGDTAELTLQLINQDGAAGAYQLDVTFQDAFADLKPLQFELQLEAQQDVRKPLPVQANALGTGTIQLTLTNPQGEKTVRSFQVGVRKPSVARSEVQYRYLKPGAQVSIPPRIDDFSAGSVTGTLLAAAVPEFVNSDWIRSLKAYPYHCLEQTVSRATATWAELNSNAATDQQALRQDLDAELRRLLSYQRIDGSFGTWSTYDVQNPWLFAYTFDFLLASELKVPEPALNAMVRWIKQQLSRSPQNSLFALQHAYSHYLLAKSRRGDLPKLRYFASYHRELLQNPSSSAFVAAAFAYYGDREQADRWFEKAVAHWKSAKKNQDKQGDMGFGARNLCDLTRLVTLMAETTEGHPALPELVAQLADVSSARHALSTYEQARLIRAGLALQKNGETPQVVLKQTSGTDQPLPVELSSQQLAKALALENSGEQGAWVSLKLRGHPKQVLDNVAQGIRVQRDILTMDGKPVTDLNFKRGDLYVVRLSGKLEAKDSPNTLLVDFLPAGFEIENALVTEETFGASLGWLKDALTPLTHFEARDDRFVAVMALRDQETFTIAYLVRAVTPGVFTYAAPVVENMYRPSVFGRGRTQKVRVLQGS